MSRTVLAAAAAVLIGLAACGGGKHSAKPAATRSKSTATPATSTQKKKTAKPDTTRQKNPLTNN
jgi:ABC-type glycerol-3-phosphate transport system substrate-binding protein